MIQPVFVRDILILLGILSAANAVLGLLSVLFFPVGFFSGKSVGRIVSDLAFIEGAAAFFVGALLAFLNSKLTSRIKALMIIGPAMIGISIVSGAIG